MGWIEMTRRTLKEVKDWLEKEQDFFLAHDYKGVAAACIHQGVIEALAAIPDEHEMVRLLRRLSEQSEIEWIKDTPENPPMCGAEALDMVIDYIEREFGYKLEDE